MPELPEVHTVVSELNRKLKGRMIESVDVRKPKVVSVGPATVGNKRKVNSDETKQFIQLLQGKKVMGVRRRAKMLIFELSKKNPHPTLSQRERGLYLLVHLKMTGQFIFEDRAQRKKTGGKYRILNRLTAPLVQLPCAYTHVIFHFTDGSTLYFNDMRQFGYLKLVTSEELSQVRELNEYGPEPLEKKFTFDVFKNVVKRRVKTSIKQVIMDPKVVVGIGNIYSDEILYHAKVKPNRLVRGITEKELEAIYNQIRPVLRKGIQAKGSSVGDFVRTDGAWGSMGKHHFVYGRRKQECKSCGSMIETIKLGGRTASYCPRCQS